MSHETLSLNYIFVEWRNVDKILICELDDLETYTTKIFNIYSVEVKSYASYFSSREKQKKLRHHI